MGETFDSKLIARRWKGYPDTKSALLDGLDKGWELRTQGKGKPRFYCPCGPGGASITVNWTPQNDRRHADRIRSDIAKQCPDQHALMR